MRIGCVKYVNACPLIRGWPGKIEFDHPSVLCRRLAKGELDVALVSSFEYLRNPIYRIVDGVSICSDGPVYSVVLAYRGDISDIKEIAFDPASQTSVNLLRCILKELGLNPRLSRNTGKMPMFQELHGAQLLIGDRAIHFRQKHAGEFQFWDLGEQWKRLTRLPFVYALWLVRPEVSDAKSIAQRLRKARQKNLASLDELIAEAAAEADLSSVASAKASYSGNRKMTREFLAQYYHEYLQFTFGEKEKQGLQRFADLCVKYGVLPPRDRPFNIV